LLENKWKYLDGNYYNLLFQPNHICSNGKYQLTDSLCNVCKVKEDYDHVFQANYPKMYFYVWRKPCFW
jgi:hypothetical protein